MDDSKSLDSRLQLADALDVQFHVLSGRDEVADPDAALQALQLALQLRRAAFEALPNDEKIALSFCVSLERCAEFLLDQGGPENIDRAIEWLAQALKIREDYFSRAPGSMQQARDVSIVSEQLSGSLLKRAAPGDLAEAQRHARRCLELAEANFEIDGGSLQIKRDLGYANYVLAKAFSGDPRQVDDACRHFERSLQLREDVLKTEPNARGLLNEVALSAEMLARTLPEGGPDVEARREQLLNRTLEIRTQILVADPGSQNAARDLAVVLTVLAELYSRAGLIERAISSLTRCVELHLQVLRARGDRWNARAELCDGYERLARACLARRQGEDIDRAISCFEASLEHREELLKAAPRDIRACAEVIVLCDQLAQLRQARGTAVDMDRAVYCLGKSVEVSRTVAELTGDSAQVRDISLSLDALAKALQARGKEHDIDSAVTHLDESLSIVHALWKANPTPNAIADLAISLRKSAEARSLRGGPGDREQANDFMLLAQTIANGS